MSETSTPKTTLKDIWGADKDAKDAAKIQDALDSIDLNAQHVVLQARRDVSAAESALAAAIESALTSHNFSAIVNAKQNLEEAKVVLNNVTKMQKELIG